MSVQDSKTVEFVSLGSEPGTALLIVSDHLDWNNSLDHQMTLQGKLNAYLAFFESGELYPRFPKAEGKRVEIRVVLQHPRDPSGEQFLRKAAEVIRQAAFHFSHQVGVKTLPPEQA